MLDFSKVKVGDKVRVLEDDVWCTGLPKGTELVVSGIRKGDLALTITTEGKGWAFDDLEECPSQLELVE